MRGLDTNVLVRFLTADDREQYLLAEHFLENCEAIGEQLFVCTTVLCELVWTLSGGRYQLKREAIADVIEELLRSSNLFFEHHDAVRLALHHYQVGPADFSDYLICEVNRRAGCTDTVTFDRNAALHEGFTAVGADPYPLAGSATTYLHEK